MDIFWAIWLLFVYPDAGIECTASVNTDGTIVWTCEIDPEDDEDSDDLEE
jgi:hypothetical protein